MARSQGTRVFAGGAHFAPRGGERYRGGLFRTALGDGDWKPLVAGLPEDVEARVVVFHPTERDVVYVGTQDGPYRSTDGGESWERLGFPERGAVVWSIEFHPSRPGVMYLGLAPVGFYRSEDGGDNWRKVSSLLSPEHCPMPFPTRTIGIAADPGRPDDLYVALEVSGLLRSSDGGESWRDLSASLVELAREPRLQSAIATKNTASGMLDSHAVRVSPGRPGEVYVAVRMGVFASTDRGESWRDIEVGRYSPLTYCRDVRFSPHDPDVMYACLSPASRSKDGSLWRSDDRGETWHRYDRNVKADATMMAVALDARDPACVCCVSRCGQVFATADGGASWHASRLPAGVEDVYTVACG